MAKSTATVKKLAAVAMTAVTLLFTLFSFAGCSLFGGASDDIAPHLISEQEQEENPIRPIDSATTVVGFKETGRQKQYDELLQIVYSTPAHHARPDFTRASAEVKQVYDTAVKVLNRYIRNDFTDFEKVHAIHDWLAYTVEYDIELLENADSASSNDASFGLKGVFLNKKAVCDGFSKAFMLLCGIEQIQCIRVTGTYDDVSGSQNHAWNKVCIDGVWYNVDVTMDNFHVRIESYSSSTQLNLLNHGYFLLSDEDMQYAFAGRHNPSGKDNPDYPCNVTYDFHSACALGIGDYTMEVTSQAQLNDIFTKIKNSNKKIGKIELKLNFPEYDKSNLARQNAYLSQISEAYGKVANADFRLDAANNTYPYQRYPNGVFVFLIYK